MRPYYFVTIILLDTCVDTSNGKTDSWGVGCNYYGNNPLQCGLYDTTDFFAKLMCCECKGNCGQIKRFSIPSDYMIPRI